MMQSEKAGDRFVEQEVRELTTCMQKDLLIRERGPAEVDVAVVDRGATPAVVPWEPIGLHAQSRMLQVNGDQIPLALLEELLQEADAAAKTFARYELEEIHERLLVWFDRERR